MHLRVFNSTLRLVIFAHLTGVVVAVSACSSAVSTTTSTLPKPSNFGIVLFPSFQAIDVFGPLDALNLLSWQYYMNLSIIASTLDPVSTIPRSAAMNPYNSTFSQSVVPTHTFSTAPDLEVLLVPGGIGTIAPDRNTTVAYIKKAFPKLRYLITVCTGAHLAAEAYVLDGKNVTTTKRSWAKVKTLGKNTHWIAPARWVVDGNIWTGSGLSSGLDVIFAWIGAVYGEDVSNGIAISMEYERTTNSTADPFSALYNATSVIGNRA